LNITLLPEWLYSGLAGFMVTTLFFTGSAIFPKAARAAFYEGKTIVVVSGGAPGGTTDARGRVLFSSWSRYIPGKPEIVFKSMVGGLGGRAAKFVADQGKARSDGRLLFWGSWLPVMQILRHPTFPVQWNEFEVLGGIGSDIRIVLIRTDVVSDRLKKPTDIIRAGTVTVGGAGYTVLQDLLTRMSLDILGVEYRYVSGYASGSTAFAALLRNEIHIMNNNVEDITHGSALEGIEKGELMPLYYFSLKDNRVDLSKYPSLQGIPSFIDLYRELYGKDPAGPVWMALQWLIEIQIKLTFAAFAPAGIPEDALKELRNSFTEALIRQELPEPLQKLFSFPPIVMDYRESQEILDSTSNVDPSIIEVFRKYTEYSTD
jgi:tripartite-type tricarboxylate transporter receptor subunit TctC